MLQMYHQDSYNSMLTTLYRDHRMNLTCDASAITVLMVITCVLIYVISNCICFYKLIATTHAAIVATCIFYMISVSIYEDVLGSGQ